jgi:hypothetical protein
LATNCLRFARLCSQRFITERVQCFATSRWTQNILNCLLRARIDTYISCVDVLHRIIGQCTSDVTWHPVQYTVSASYNVYFFYLIRKRKCVWVDFQIVWYKTISKEISI